MRDFVNLYHLSKFTTGEMFRFPTVVDPEIWILSIIHKPACKIQTRQVTNVKFAVLHD